MVHRRRRDAGISMVLVVILIVITVGLAVTAAIFWAEMEQKQRRQKAMLELRQQLATEQLIIRQAMADCNTATGIRADSEDGLLPVGKAEETMKKWRQEYFSVEALDRFPLVPPREGDAKLKKEAIDGFNRAKEEVMYMRTLQQLVEPAATRTNHFLNRMKQLELELEVAKESTKIRQAATPEFPKKKVERKAELQASIGKLNDEIAKENETYAARKAKLTEDKAKAEQEAAADVEKFASEEIKLQNEIRENRRQLEELKVKEVIKHEISFVHGKLLRPDVPNKRAYIDIGSRERVVPGLKFLVGKRGVQGKFEYKGKVEVKKVWMTHAEVAIIELTDPEFKPMIEGDQIVNPLFSKVRPIVLAFIGEDRPLKLRYSVDEASRRIREIGSDVRKDVSLDVDYVVFTEGGVTKPRETYETWQKAVFLEIPIAEASDIFRFLGD